MHCIHDGNAMDSVGIEGQQSAFICPKCHRVQILATRARPGAELCMVPCIYLYESSLSAAGQLPSCFQTDLFQPDLFSKEG